MRAITVSRLLSDPRWDREFRIQGLQLVLNYQALRDNVYLRIGIEYKIDRDFLLCCEKKPFHMKISLFSYSHAFRLRRACASGIQFFDGLPWTWPTGVKFGFRPLPFLSFEVDGFSHWGAIWPSSLQLKQMTLDTFRLEDSYDEPSCSLRFACEEDDSCLSPRKPLSRFESPVLLFGCDGPARRTLVSKRDANAIRPSRVAGSS